MGKKHLAAHAHGLHLTLSDLARFLYDWDIDAAAAPVNSLTHRSIFHDREDMHIPTLMDTLDPPDPPVNLNI